MIRRFRIHAGVVALIPGTKLGIGLHPRVDALRSRAELRVAVNYSGVETRVGRLGVTVNSAGIKLGIEATVAVGTSVIVFRVTVLRPGVVARVVLRPRVELGRIGAVLRPRVAVHPRVAAPHPIQRILKIPGAGPAQRVTVVMVTVMVSAIVVDHVQLFGTVLDPQRLHTTAATAAIITTLLDDSARRVNRNQSRTANIPVRTETSLQRVVTVGQKPYSTTTVMMMTVIMVRRPKF